MFKRTTKVDAKPVSEMDAKALGCELVGRSSGYHATGAHWVLRCGCGKGIVRSGMAIRKNLKNNHRMLCEFCNKHNARRHRGVTTKVDAKPISELDARALGCELVGKSQGFHPTGAHWIIRCACGSEMLRSGVSIRKNIKNKYRMLCESCNKRNGRRHRGSGRKAV